MKPFHLIVDNQLAQQRWQANEARREQPEVDPRSMLLVLENLIAEGRMEEAKARARYQAERGN